MIPDRALESRERDVLNAGPASTSKGTLYLEICLDLLGLAVTS